jgi:serine kinase of HPr protein (carbohydrate metabolism regulator)
VTEPLGASIHASAVLVGDRAVLIRGPSGAGKSRLAFDLILAGRAGQIPTALLVGDDRVTLEAMPNQLVVRPADALAGLIEIRGLGIRRCDFAPEAIVGLVVDLDAADAERLPPPEALNTTIAGVKLARIPVKAGYSPLPLVAAALTTIEGYVHVRHFSDCSKGIGNHISPTIATD